MEWIYELVLDVLLGIFIYRVSLQKKKEKEKRKEKESLEHYIAELSNCYRKYRNVEAAEEEARGRVREGSSLPQEALLERLCHLVRETGDRKWNGTSLFLKNLSYLREELKEDVLFLENRTYCFMGLGKLCILPFFLIPCITVWARSVLETLAVYYQGSFSVVTTTICFVITALSYELVTWLELPDLIQKLDYRLEKKLLQKPWVAASVNRKVNRRFMYYLRRNERLKLVQGYGNIREFLLKKRCSAFGYLCFGLFAFGMIWEIGGREIPSQLQFPEIYTLLEEEEIDEVEAKMREQFFALCEGEMTLEEAEAGWSSYESEIGATAFLQVQERYEQWRGHKKKIVVLLLAIPVAVFGYCKPELLLLLREEAVKQERMEEVRRMQTVCLVLAQDASVTVEQMLEGMEESAVLFQKALEETVDHFSYDREGGIETLRREAACAPMGRICDMLIACGEVGIEEACGGLEEERAYTLREELQQRAERMRERAALAKLLAYLPFLTVLILKLILPFVAEGLSELQLYSNGMLNYF